MSRRVVLWVAFAIVHVAIARLGFVLPNEPMGDVYRVYQPWSACALWGGVEGFCPAGREIMGITVPWVYPQLALVPMVLAWLFAWTGSYTVGWVVMVVLANAGAFALLVGRGRSRGRSGAAWFWLASIALLGPVGLYRLDGFTAALAVAGCLWLAGRPFVASALLAIATWIKVWPAALLAAAVITGRRRGPVVIGALVVSAVTLIVVVAGGGGAYAFGFVQGQTDRGLQIEAPVSAFYLWRAVLGLPGSQVFYDGGLLTFQVTGPQVDALIAIMTPLLAFAMIAVVAIGARKAWLGARYAVLFPPLALTVVMTFIVVNKVGSPQFASWIAAPLVLGLVLDRRRWRGPASLALVTVLLTQLVYPLLYAGVLTTAPLPIAVLTVRNALYLALLVWALVRLVRVPVRPGIPRSAPSALTTSI
ncbi:DUF2029 domain-containing protein [Microbacterium sp. zg-YB36]|uniref:DUF2029 domain-containing protein n=1 Tax=Microbacterium sp. zg-YB36 TaxID=2969407 RepID=UPI00214CE4CF|nr:DUF2029 domain-containing protein [Microbacterium sp. zg-YB36]MDL5352638.1 DUF2029 domain-containing protein [Microbacterium sp. zg-YB36]